MILRVLRICSRLFNKKRIFVATDDKRTKKIVETNNFSAIMTSSKCLTGTDRVAEANIKIKSNIIINVQGDEPLIKLVDIKKILDAKNEISKTCNLWLYIHYKKK